MRNVDPGNFNAKIVAAQGDASLAYIAGSAGLACAFGLVALIARFA